MACVVGKIKENTKSLSSSRPQSHKNGVEHALESGQAMAEKNQKLLIRTPPYAVQESKVQCNVAGEGIVSVVN